MSIEDTLARTLSERLDQTSAPRVDLPAIRRGARRRRLVRRGIAGAAVVAVVAGAAGAVQLAGDGGSGVGPDGGRTVSPARAPAWSADHGTRAYYDDVKGEMHLGDESFRLPGPLTIDTAGAATPWGVVFFGDDQAPQLLTPTGRVESLGEAPERTGTPPTVKFDSSSPRIAWLSGDSSGATLSVRAMRPTGEQGSLEVYDVPCGGGCGEVAMGGIDHGKVFVRAGNGAASWVLDEASGTWTTLEGTWVADVRSRVVLVDGKVPPSGRLGEGWRFAAARGVESLLTFDGGHEIYWSTTLRSTSGGEPVRLRVPTRGTPFVTVDSDGSVLVALSTSSGSQLYFDCTVPEGACTKFGELTGGTSGDPIFVGNDM